MFSFVLGVNKEVNSMLQFVRLVNHLLSVLVKVAWKLKAYLRCFISFTVFL